MFAPTHTVILKRIAFPLNCTFLVENTQWCVYIGDCTKDHPSRIVRISQCVPCRRKNTNKRTIKKKNVAMPRYYCCNSEENNRQNKTEKKNSSKNISNGMHMAEFSQNVGIPD